MKVSAGEGQVSYAVVKMTDESLQEPYRVTLAIPSWVIAVVDAEATRMGVSRSAVINTWLVEKVDALTEKRIELEARRREAESE